MLSFSVCLYHVPVIQLVHRNLPTLQPGWLWNLTAVVTTCSVTYASYKLVERRWHANL